MLIPGSKGHTFHTRMKKRPHLKKAVCILYSSEYKQLTSKFTFYLSFFDIIPNTAIIIMATTHTQPIIIYFVIPPPSPVLTALSKIILYDISHTSTFLYFIINAMPNHAP